MSIFKALSQESWEMLLLKHSSELRDAVALKALLVDLSENGSWDDIHFHEGYPLYVKAGGKNLFGKRNLHRRELQALCSIFAKGEDSVYGDVISGRMLDESYTVLSGDRATEYRFRIHIVACESGGGSQGVRIACRSIKDVVPTIADVQISETELDELFPLSGAVYVGGETGSGKSTTLAACIGQIIKSSKRARTILEWAQPVEYTYRSLINSLGNRNVHIMQHAVGRDVPNFVEAVRSSLRSNGDTVIIGEMREYETIDAALLMANSGHHVLGTVHTKSPVDAFNRISKSFPADQQDRALAELASSTKTLVNQILLPSVDGARVPVRAWLSFDDSLEYKLLKSNSREYTGVLVDAYREQGRTFEANALALLNEGRISSATYKLIAKKEANTLEAING